MLVSFYLTIHRIITGVLHAFCYMRENYLFIPYHSIRCLQSFCGFFEWAWAVMNGKPFMFTETEINGQALNLKSIMKWRIHLFGCSQAKIANKTIANSSMYIYTTYTYIRAYIHWIGRKFSWIVVQMRDEWQTKEAENTLATIITLYCFQQH